jgi:hypothetical protein
MDGEEAQCEANKRHGRCSARKPNNQNHSQDDELIDGIVFILDASGTKDWCYTNLCFGWIIPK